MSGAEDERDQRSDGCCGQCGDGGTEGAAAQGGTDGPVTHRDVGSGHEHDEREADVRDEREGGIGGVHQAQPGAADGDPRQQLPQHHGQVPFPRECQERAKERHRRDQRQLEERHTALLRRGWTVRPQYQEARESRGCSGSSTPM